VEPSTTLHEPLKWGHGDTTLPPAVSAAGRVPRTSNTGVAPTLRVSKWAVAEYVDAYRALPENDVSEVVTLATTADCDVEVTVKEVLACPPWPPTQTLEVVGHVVTLCHASSLCSVRDTKTLGATHSSSSCGGGPVWWSSQACAQHIQ
jgi:hypothetical protein